MIYNEKCALSNSFYCAIGISAVVKIIMQVLGVEEVDCLPNQDLVAA